ncbi:MAG: arsenate reductase (glutaredoxin) [Natronospirillum sp.]
MKDIKIYHNPRCSKSRQTLNLLQEHGIEPQVELYMDTPPTKAEMKQLLNKLGLDARDLLGCWEAAYKKLGLADKSLGEDALIDAMRSEPKLIQRPIVVAADRAVLGRPPENALDLIK